MSFTAQWLKEREEDSGIKRLESQLATKDAIIQELKAVVSFYADQDNWTIDRDATDEANENNIHAAFAAYGSIIDDREISGVSLGHLVNSIGGKRARECLRKIEEMEGR